MAKRHENITINYSRKSELIKRYGDVLLGILQ